MLRDLVAFGRVAARAVVESDVLGSLRPRGFATLARRLVQRSLPSGPTAVLSLYAAHEPDREALIDEEGTLHYGELDAEVDALARGLAALGVRPGDRVAIMMPNARAYLLVQWATLRRPRRWAWPCRSSAGGPTQGDRAWPTCSATRSP